MRVTYDPEVDAAYIYLADIGPGKVENTVPLDEVNVGAGSIHLDFDRSETLIGIEVLGALATLPRDLLDKAEKPKTRPER